MTITILGFFFGLLLLALPIYLIYALRLNMMKQLLLSLGRMVVVVALYGFVLWVAIREASMALNILFAVLLSIASTLVVVGKGRVEKSVIAPLFAGSVLSAFVMTLYVLFAVLMVKEPFQAHSLLPVMGLLTGCSAGYCARGLHIYSAGLARHGQLYIYLRGNGATDREARRYFIRRCFQATLAPMLKTMVAIGLTTAPVLLYALVQGGVDVMTACALQLLLVVVVLAMSFSALGITLWMAKRS